ncbi:MAG TPA: response regulator transcription factor [Rubricoccaceae bacterium]|jgi:two-component system response regulator DesR
MSPQLSTVAAPLHVLIADDSAIVRSHLVEMLGQIKDVEIVAEAGDTTSAVAQVQEHRPEVVVLDIQMPGEGGVVALRQIKHLLPDTHVLMLTNHADPFYRRRCMKEGADAFFDKSTEFLEVGAAIRVLSEGGALGRGVA